MRGDYQPMTDIRQAVAVLDLALAGVHAELADTSFDWFAVAKPVAPRPMQVVDLGRQEAGGQVGRVQAERKLDPEAVQLPVKKAPVEIEKAEVWTGGEAGGVLLVVQGAMPDERCVMLAQAMLVAAGLKDVALGWVGYFGKVEATVLLDAMRGMKPEQVLVLGQAPLGVLLGRNLGVEGWHASDTKDISGWDGVVGVTYPLELLIKQPLFKRLAWQHLLSWGL